MPPDYSGQNLRGRSFKGQNLEGANFSNADIRGANFTNAFLRGADFSGAKAGLPRRWIIGGLIYVFLMLAVLGFFSIMISILIAYIFDTKNSENLISGIFTLFTVIVFCIVTIAKDFIAGSGAIVLASIISYSVAFITDGATAAAFAGAGIGSVAFVLVVAFCVCTTAAIDRATTAALAASVAVVLAGVITAAVAVVLAGVITAAVATATAVILVVVGTYIGWRSLKGDEKDAWIRLFAIAFAATGGTSFRGADLTDVNFTGATLKNTDFRTSNLTRTRFYEAKKLNFARPGNTILANLAVLNLLISCNGRNKSYIGANLRGANLTGADLKEANLKDADIIEATFQGACLEWANLTLTQAVGTNFTKAQMTGACVEAWNIESTTILDDVDCRFVYLLEYPKPRTDDRERRPSSGEFQRGEFTKLFEEVLNTVDLIVRNGIDWKAFVGAFQGMQIQNEDTELSIQSIENKGDGVVVIKVNAPEVADKEKIHSDFTQNYQLALAEVEKKYKSLLQAKDEEIILYRQQSSEMREIVNLLANPLANPSINVQVDNQGENKIITNSNNDSHIFNNFGTLKNSGKINLGKISGTVKDSINELPSASEAEKQGIKELLTQLQTAIEADTDFTDKDKEKALKQVQALAQAAQNPQENKDVADTAIMMLKGLLSDLSSATKLIAECSKLLPLISVFLGLEINIQSKDLRIVSSHFLYDTNSLVDNLGNYVDLTIVTGLQNLLQLYREYLLQENYVKVIETADSAYQMCQKIAESLDKEREKDIYVRVTSLAAYWKLNKDLYRGFILK